MTTGGTETRIEVASGAQIAVEIVGEGDAVVLMHGLGGFKELWAESASALARGGWRAIAFDHRGHGGSTDVPAPWTIADLGGDLESLLDALGVERAFLVGHSMGGRVLFQFALDHPERVSGLVIVAAQSEPPHGWYRDVLANVQSATREKGLDGFREAFCAADELPARVDLDPEYGTWFANRFERNRAASIDVSLSAILGMTSLTGRLSEIAAPTLVVVGSDDRAFTDIAARYERVIPDCTVVVVADCTHYPMVDEQDAFTHALLTFLDANRP